MKIHGGCHCRSVRYEAEIDPLRVTICHCTDCQQLTGSAFRVTVRTLQKDFVLLCGTPKTYIKTADSGAKRAQVFCPDCGSPLYAHALGQSETYGLRVGGIDERQSLVPSKQIWCRSALGWVENLAAMPRQAGE